MGLYLAFTLSHKYAEEESNTKGYNLVLLLIMISSILTSFGGKYLSNQIVRKILFNNIVYGNKLINSWQDGH